MKKLFKTGVLGVFLLLLGCCGAFAQESIADIALDSMSGISDVFIKNMNNAQTLGKPVEAGEFIIIPVLCKGIGFGLGTKLDDGKKVGPAPMGKVDSKNQDRLGLGGGAFLKPVALIMINKKGEFKVVRLCEGIFAQLAKYMLPAIGTLVRKTIVTISREKMKHERSRMKKHGKMEKRIEIKKMDQPVPPPPPMAPKAP